MCLGGLCIKSFWLQVTEKFNGHCFKMKENVHITSLELGGFHGRLIRWPNEIIKDLGYCMIVSYDCVDSSCSLVRQAKGFGVNCLNVCNVLLNESVKSVNIYKERLNKLGKYQQRGT